MLEAIVSIAEAILCGFKQMKLAGLRRLLVAVSIAEAILCGFKLPLFPPLNPGDSFNR